MNILLINDNTEHLNWGAQATVFALKKMFAEKIADLYLDAIPWNWLRRSYREVQFSSGRKMTYRRWQHNVFVEKFLNRVSYETEFFPVIFDDFDYYADRWMAGDGGPDAPDFLRRAKYADVVVYNGENSIYRNTIEGCRALFLLWVSKTRLGKHSAIINHTAHLDDVQPRMPAMVRHLFPLLDLVTCREPSGWRQIREMGIDHAELVPDAVFYLRDNTAGDQAFETWKQSAGLDGRPYFCLSGSALPASEPHGSWDGKVVELVRALQKTGTHPVLVAKDPECLFLEEVARRTGGSFFGPEHSFHELWPLFRGASFLVSGHYHYVIAAASVGCPFIPLSVNNRKMKGVCMHLEWQRTEPFDITDLGSCMPEILDETQRLLRHRESLSTALRLRTERLCEESGLNALRVLELVNAAQKRTSAGVMP
jgi:Polysaccharide pyruvyl transferase